MDVIASKGLRVLAFAHKSISNYQPDTPRDEIESNLTFSGLIGIYDPPRPESAPSVQAFHNAGIVVHMLTGDHPQTAAAIARDVNILPPNHSSSAIMTAQAFDALSDSDIDALPELPLVVARCAPSTKVRMIEALHRRDRYVAMTGDGVNDSPSLKRADIGIAMGSGSDVAKESSDIVLTDDNFASILNAIEEGRRIFDNIQKFILHVLAANIGFVVALLTGLAFKDSTGVSIFQLTPVEILWMLLGTGAFCETGLGFERAVADILNRPPHNVSASSTSNDRRQLTSTVEIRSLYTRIPRRHDRLRSPHGRLRPRLLHHCSLRLRLGQPRPRLQQQVLLRMRCRLPRQSHLLHDHDLDLPPFCVGAHRLPQVVLLHAQGLQGVDAASLG